MSEITTGVDKLMQVVREKGKVELEEAAKDLHVKPEVVQEWADFLEDEGFISIKYSLSKVYLTGKKVSGDEARKKTKEFGMLKEVFNRKIDAAIGTLDRETISFDTLKKEFHEIEGEIGKEVEKIKEELDQLKKYEDYKKDIDSNLKSERGSYEKLIHESHQQLDRERKKYESLLAEIQQEEVQIQKEERELKTIEDLEQNIEEKIGQLQSMVDKLKAEIKSEKKDIETSRDHVESLKKLSDKVKTEIDSRRDEKLTPLVKKSEDQEARIIELQEKIIRKAKETKQEMGDFQIQSEKISKHFESFFEKRNKIDQTINQIEKDREELKRDYRKLLQKAMAFDVASKSATTEKLNREMEASFNDLESKRKGLSSKVEQLFDFIRKAKPEEKK